MARVLLSPSFECAVAELARAIRAVAPHTGATAGAMLSAMADQQILLADGPAVVAGLLEAAARGVESEPGAVDAATVAALRAIAKAAADLHEVPGIRRADDRDAEWERIAEALDLVTRGLAEG
jgi:hypothetical protein